jgi:hypothetical protein
MHVASRKILKAEDKHLCQVGAQSQFSKYRSENKEETQFSETRKVRESVLWDVFQYRWSQYTVQSTLCTSDNTNAHTSRHNNLRSPFTHNVPKPYPAVRKLKIFYPKLLWWLNTSSLIMVIKISSKISYNRHREASCWLRLSHRVVNTAEAKR